MLMEQKSLLPYQKFRAASERIEELVRGQTKVYFSYFFKLIFDTKIYLVHGTDQCNYFSKVLYLVSLYTKNTRALTFWEFKVVIEKLRVFDAENFPARQVILKKKKHEK